MGNCLEENSRKLEDWTIIFVTFLISTLNFVLFPCWCTSETSSDADAVVQNFFQCSLVLYTLIGLVHRGVGPLVVQHGLVHGGEDLLPMLFGLVVHGGQQSNRVEGAT